MSVRLRPAAPRVWDLNFMDEQTQLVTDQTEKVSYEDAQIQELDIAKIVPNPFQPRKIFNQEALQELADSIREHGVIQPLVVTETATGFELVVGERRFRASQLAGLTRIPAIVKKTLHDQTKLEVALIENIQRQELNAIEEAQAYDRLMKNFNLTQEQVAQKVGKSRPAVANTLRLLNLPAEVQRGIIEGKISEGHGRAILGLPDIEKQLLMYKMILEQGLNVRQVEAKVREIVVRRKIDAATPDPKLMAIETELRGKLGAQVKILRQGRGGKITIDFFSDEELEDIIQRMAEQKANEDNNYFTVWPVEFLLLVGMPGIEPGLHPPHGRVLPVYYIPLRGKNSNALYVRYYILIFKKFLDYKI